MLMTMQIEMVLLQDGNKIKTKKKKKNKKVNKATLKDVIEMVEEKHTSFS